MSLPYFVNPRLNFKFQGPEKKYPAVTGFDLLAKTGSAYEARKNDMTGAWKAKAYGSGTKQPTPAPVLAGTAEPVLVN